MSCLHFWHDTCPGRRLYYSLENERGGRHNLWPEHGTLALENIRARRIIGGLAYVNLSIHPKNLGRAFQR
jgi:hypothetical protein